MGRFSCLEFGPREIAGHGWRATARDACERSDIPRPAPAVRSGEKRPCCPRRVATGQHFIIAHARLWSGKKPAPGAAAWHGLSPLSNRTSARNQTRAVNEGIAPNNRRWGPVTGPQRLSWSKDMDGGARLREIARACATTDPFDEPPPWFGESRPSVACAIAESCHDRQSARA